LRGRRKQTEVRQTVGSHFISLGTIGKIPDALTAATIGQVTMSIRLNSIAARALSARYLHG